ncbi:hypothetical protein RHGRI_036999 [Rhododendron griersonianum]|uniref:Uncharacterized protein n=1 Tax=Rhododendron griersonianum TaxID=479676 RepID=A0AAV6HQ26_9ERIC|nr:hypothetical protein RHGRI_036999 [Rhododendron griersonianum]
MELIHVNIDRPNGITGTDILFAASANGSLSFYVVGKVRQQFDYGIGCMPDRVWPLSIEEGERFVELPGHLWRPSGASVNMSSKISCMKMHGKHSDSDGLPRQHLMITSLGSEASGGSVYTLNLSEPLDYDLSSLMLRRRIYKAASFNCTVWTADCNSDGSQAVVGKFFTATFGKIVLCGLRNGAIVTVDTREKSEGLSARLARHQIPYASQGTCKPSSTTPRNLTKRCFELRGNISQSHITSMPSSISCLASLQLYDQCFLASSMDGSDLTWSHGFENERLTDGSHACSLFFEEGLTGNLVVKLVIIEDAIRLYDHRLMQRGPVQFYEGNVNSHTRIQLGVDPFERFFMSGGEDCNLRLWGIKSGELLYEDKFMSSVPSVVCWPGGTAAVGLHLFFSFPSPTILSSTFQQNFQECKIKAKTTETMCTARNMVRELGLDPKKGYFMCAGHEF